MNKNKETYNKVPRVPKRVLERMKNEPHAEDINIKCGQVKLAGEYFPTYKLTVWDFSIIKDVEAKAISKSCWKKVQSILTNEGKYPEKVVTRAEEILKEYNVIIPDIYFSGSKNKKEIKTEMEAQLHPF